MENWTGRLLLVNKLSVNSSRFVIRSLTSVLPSNESPEIPECTAVTPLLPLLRPLRSRSLTWTVTTRVRGGRGECRLGGARGTGGRVFPDRWS